MVSARGDPYGHYEVFGEFCVLVLALAVVLTSVVSLTPVGFKGYSMLDSPSLSTLVLNGAVARKPALSITGDAKTVSGGKPPFDSSYLLASVTATPAVFNQVDDVSPGHTNLRYLL